VARALGDSDPRDRGRAAAARAHNENCINGPGISQRGCGRQHGGDGQREHFLAATALRCDAEERGGPWQSADRAAWRASLSHTRLAARRGMRTARERALSRSNSEP
jgi:hypothetical protein